MDLDGILLGLLRSSATGYDIKQAFAQMLGHFWDAELSQIYRSLQRLEDRGLLRSHQQASEKGPARRVYTITAAGRKQLRGVLRQPPQRTRQRFPGVAQLHFMGELGDPEATARYVRALQEQFRSALQPLRDIESHWRQSDPRYPERLPDDAFHAHLTLSMGMARLQALDQWAEDALRTINNRLERAQAPGDTQ